VDIDIDMDMEMDKDTIFCFGLNKNNRNLICFGSASCLFRETEKRLHIIKMKLYVLVCKYSYWRAQWDGAEERSSLLYYFFKRKRYKKLSASI
jgi:sensor histidine kinase YesM